jgi:hypothetical protein
MDRTRRISFLPWQPEPLGTFVFVILEAARKTLRALITNSLRSQAAP